MHFYESSIITTKDGLHCQVYSNEHPTGCIIVKPKYIPTDKISSNALSSRFISGNRMNRLNMWVEKEELKKYMSAFKEKYPQYIFKSPLHNKERLFFGVPIDNIDRVYFPRKGLQELMSMPNHCLDDHLKNVHSFVEFLLKSGLSIKDLGVTYSTLMGHYLSSVSDINIVVYGKNNFWKLMEFLETAQHPLLRWKTKEEWAEYYNKRNRFAIFDKSQFIKDMQKKKSEGFFNNTLFVIFGTEKEEEVWSKWGEEKYSEIGFAKIEGIVTNNFSCIVRPGCYDIKDVKIVKGPEIDSTDIRRVVFHSRDYCMLASPGEKICACGILEKVEPNNGKSYFRIVVGYIDSYITDRREKEYIKVIR